MPDDQQFFDEMHGFSETPRPPYASYCSWFAGEDGRNLKRKAEQAAAKALLDKLQG